MNTVLVVYTVDVDLCSVVFLLVENVVVVDFDVTVDVLNAVTVAVAVLNTVLVVYVVVVLLDSAVDLLVANVVVYTVVV